MNNGAIAFLDILGFKGLWKKIKPKVIIDLIKEAINEVKDSYKEPSLEQGWVNLKGPYISVLSDTVVIAFEYKNQTCLIPLANVVYSVMYNFFKNDIFMRGAISFGPYYHESGIFLGEAVDDVAIWYEKFDWIGVCTTPKTSYLIEMISSLKIPNQQPEFDAYIRYDIPTKEKGITYNLHCLNLFEYLRSGYSRFELEKSKLEAIKFISHLFSKQGAINPDVARKYENTLRFAKFSLKI